MFETYAEAFLQVPASTVGSLAVRSFADGSLAVVSVSLPDATNLVGSCGRTGGDEPSSLAYVNFGVSTAIRHEISLATSSPLVSVYDPAAMSSALATPVTASMGKAHATVEAFFKTLSVSVGVPPSPALPVAVGVVTSSPLASDPVGASSGKPSASVGVSVPPASALPKSEFEKHVSTILNDDKFSELEWLLCFYDRS